MPRHRLTTVLPPRTKHEIMSIAEDLEKSPEQIPSRPIDNDVENAILDIWRKAFPHLPSRFYPGWDFELDNLNKTRAKLYRKVRTSDDPTFREQCKRQERDITRQIKNQVRENKRDIIRIILEEFEPLLVHSEEVLPCCHKEPTLQKHPGWLKDPNGFTGHGSCSIMTREMASSVFKDVMRSPSSSQRVKLSTILTFVPRAHLTRRLGVVLIDHCTNLHRRGGKQLDQEDIQRLKTKFLDRYHRFCTCGSMCPNQEHGCT